ncbi:hypothetical protein HZI73_23870 [Vallitalea pronyensis]|uniref:FUSC family protein n=1 Tax=Vallitalea pronyensis TaxID=1348613 RepID=A0A8J8MNN1_9FIRM|nr:aromatic acid exporter family protein [Vallitalea pronyensis]QUI25145.1 hypothetical protein HZI73_23870 [Vallitalea pronyensis]
MKKLLSFFSFKKEAWLFDSKLYIFKTFLSVMTAYAIASFIPLLQKDMISLLFGLLLTLEPVTITGIRSGLDQIYATTLGAILTALIITLFGINIWTVALSIALTLFVSLKINWKVVSVVALFTAIYMTQYVQLDAAGLPSAYLTFQLRITALGTGVAVAILFNFIFSLFSYRRMEEKRIAYLLHAIATHFSLVKDGLAKGNSSIILEAKNNLPHTFNDIDSLFSLLTDKEKEYAFKKKLHLPSKLAYNKALKQVITSLRNITHLLYDTSYSLLGEQTVKADAQVIELMEDCIVLVKTFANYFEHNKNVHDIEQVLHKNRVQPCEDHHLVNHRIIHNVKSISENLSTIHEELLTLHV